MVDDSITEDFDFEFIEGTIESSAEEMNTAFQTTLDDLSNALKDAEEIESAQEIANTIKGQIAGITAIQDSFSTLIDRTNFVQRYARQQQQEKQNFDIRWQESLKDRENMQHKIGYLEEELSREKDQVSTYERNTTHLESEIEELRQELQAKQNDIDERKDNQIALEQEIEETNQEKAGEKSKHQETSDHLNIQLEENQAQLKMLEHENQDFKQRCQEYENKIASQDIHQAQLEKKFEQWETAFKSEIVRHKDRTELYKAQMEGDQKALTEKLEQQEQEITDLKLELTSKEMEMQTNDLQYDDLEEEFENTVDQEEREEIGLDSGFNRTVDASQLEVNDSRMPLVDNELNELSGADGMMGAAGEKDYAELSHDVNDIFETDNYNEEEKAAYLESLTMPKGSTSQQTASTISQKWEADARKDPEEEYFRLSCLALKIIYNEHDTDFVFTVSPGKLYVKCKKQKVPFHLWYSWIEQELIKVNEMQRKAVEAQARPKSLMERLTAAVFSTRSRH